MIGSGRKKPYTEIGILRMPCARCGGKATHQWQICSDGNLWRPVCVRCDIDLNAVVLEFMGDPQRQVKIAKYRKRQESEQC